MNPIGLDFNSASQIDVGASNAKVGAASPSRQTGALQLADALSSLNPKLQGAATALAAEEQMVQGAAAKKLAIETGAKKLADAVRDGQIESTQNPYFIQDYNREAAAVSTQAALDKLNTDAAQWEEKNDPVAFRERYTQAIQDIGKDYDGSPDSQEGFRAIAVQNSQQAFAANTAYNVQRITQERQENLSALVAKAIVQANAKAGGKATGSQLETAIQPLMEQWLKTGGDIAQWNKVTLQGVLAASFNTHSESILDAAKTMSNHLGGLDGGSLYDTLGSAEQIESARFRLEAETRDALRLKMAVEQDRRFQQGLAAQGALFTLFGPRMYSGGVSPEEQQKAATALADRFPAAAVGTAFKEAAQVTSAIRELNSNRATLYEQSPQGGTHLATLVQEANQRGWTPELQNDLGQLLLQGNASESTVREISDMASRQTAKMSQNGGIMGTNPVMAAKKAAENIRKWSTARSAITTAITNGVAYALRNGHTISPAQQQQVQDVALQAASTWLELHPGDFKGANAAAMENAKHFVGAIK